MSIFFSYYPIIAGRRTIPIERGEVKKLGLRKIGTTDNAVLYEKGGKQYARFKKEDL